MHPSRCLSGARTARAVLYLSRDLYRRQSRRSRHTPAVFPNRPWRGSKRYVSLTGQPQNVQPSERG
eukprot:1350429-Prymnesium_polylepis.1